MPRRSTHTVTTRPRERAILVGVIRSSGSRTRTTETLEELALLADSAGAEVVHQLVQARHSLDAATFIGKGKAEELAWLVGRYDVQLAIFDDDLSPVQLRNLENTIPCKILDRSGLILDIFASRARTSEAKTQVELAQLQYMLPRLTRQWTHLSKQYGGIGTKGPGETQIETDRRVIRTRITHLKERLQKIGMEREIQRKGRERLPRVALVGYTNAGKSTLLNRLAEADVLVEDRLFATLDSTVRKVHLSGAHRILLSDTVGFIRKLPHHLVASFESTLAEVREADILLHIVDVSNPHYDEHVAVVNDTLADIGAGGKPTILVFNKIDRLPDRRAMTAIRKDRPGAVFMSASRGINLTGLTEAIAALLEEGTVEETIRLGQEDYPLIARIHETTDILERRYEGETVIIRFRATKATADQIRKLAPPRKKAKGPASRS